MPPGSGCKTAAPIIQLRLVSWVTTTVNQISCTLWFIFPLSYPSLCYGLLIWFWDSDLSPALFAYIVSQWDPDLGPEIQMILRYNQTATVTEQLFKNQLKNGKTGYATSRSDLVSWRSRIKVKQNQERTEEKFVKPESCRHLARCWTGKISLNSGESSFHSEVCYGLWELRIFTASADGLRPGNMLFFWNLRCVVSSTPTNIFHFWSWHCSGDWQPIAYNACSQHCDILMQKM